MSQIMGKGLARLVPEKLQEVDDEAVLKSLQKALNFLKGPWAFVVYNNEYRA